MLFLVIRLACRRSRRSCRSSSGGRSRAGCAAVSTAVERAVLPAEHHAGVVAVARRSGRPRRGSSPSRSCGRPGAGSRPAPRTRRGSRGSGRRPATRNRCPPSARRRPSATARRGRARRRRGAARSLPGRVDPAVGIRGADRSRRREQQGRGGRAAAAGGAAARRVPNRARAARRLKKNGTSLPRRAANCSSSWRGTALPASRFAATRAAAASLDPPPSPRPHGNALVEREVDAETMAGRLEHHRGGAHAPDSPPAAPRRRPSPRSSRHAPRAARRAACRPGSRGRTASRCRESRRLSRASTRRKRLSLACAGTVTAAWLMRPGRAEIAERDRRARQRPGAEQDDRKERRGVIGDGIRGRELVRHAVQRQRGHDGGLELSDEARRELHGDAEHEQTLQQQRAEHSRPEYRTPRTPRRTRARSPARCTSDQTTVPARRRGERSAASPCRIPSIRITMRSASAPAGSRRRTTRSAASGNATTSSAATSAARPAGRRPAPRART